MNRKTLQRFLIRMARKCNILYETFNTDLDSKDEVEMAWVSGLAKGMRSLGEDDEQGRGDQAFWEIMRDIGTVGVDLPEYEDSCRMLGLDPANPVMPELKNLKPNF